MLTNQIWKKMDRLAPLFPAEDALYVTKETGHSRNSPFSVEG